MKELLLRALEPKILLIFILVELGIWILLIPPTVLFFSNSVAFVVFVSVYAIIRTSLADLRIWKEEQKHAKELIYQTKILHRLEETLDEAEQILGHVREDTRGEGTKGS